MLGCYYLHTNGDLIFKHAGCFFNTTPAEYFESDFVVKWWEFPSESPTGSPEGDIKWTMDLLREAYELSTDKSRTEKRIRDICQSNGFPVLIADTIIKGKEE